jgi:hypothetical protein
MDKLKKYVGYAGLGLVGGFICLFLLVGILAGWDWDRVYNSLAGLDLDKVNVMWTIFLIIPGLGGILAGGTAEKWLSAIVRGFGASFLLYIVYFIVYFSMGYH